MRRAGDQVASLRVFPLGRALPVIRAGKSLTRWLALLGVALMAGCQTETTPTTDSTDDETTTDPVPTAPTALFSHSVVDSESGPSTVLFDARQSVAGTSITAEGTIVLIPIISYTWDFGDQSDIVIGSEPFPVEHTYSAGGTYTVTLTIEDEAGQ